MNDIWQYMMYGPCTLHTSLQGFQGRFWQGPAHEQLAVQQWTVQKSERGVAGVDPLCPRGHNCDSHSICTEDHKALQPAKSSTD